MTTRPPQLAGAGADEVLAEADAGAPLRVALLGAVAANGSTVAGFADALMQALREMNRMATAAGAIGTGHGSQTPTRSDVQLELLADDDGLGRCDGALLLTAGLQPHRESELRQALAAHSLLWSVVHGDGKVAIEAAVDAITFWLLRRRPSAPVLAGLLGRLERREAAQPAWRWSCDSCDSPECEHRSFATTRATRVSA